MKNFCKPKPLKLIEEFESLRSYVSQVSRLLHAPMNLIGLGELITRDA